MERLLGRFSEPIYAVFRIVVGLLFLQHGLRKLFGLLGGYDGKHPGETVEYLSQYGLAGAIELTCGALVAVGFQAGWAGFIASGMMAVAYFQAHQPRGTLPIENGGELAVLYCFAFLLIAAKGSGILSISGPRKQA